MSDVRGLRVAIVSQNYPPHLGGLEVVVQQQATRLAARGAEVTVVASAAGGAVGSAVESGVLVRRVPAWHGLERFGVPFPFFAPSLAGHLYRAVRRADVVHVHDVLYITSWVAVLLARLLRKPVVVTQHVGMVDHPSPIVRGAQVVVRRTLGRLVTGSAAAMLPISEFIEADSRRIAPPGVPVSVIPNGVDTEHFRPALDEAERATIRREFGLGVDDKLALFIGRFVPKKGFDHLARCGSDEYRVVFVGGDRPPQVTDPRLVFLGRLDHDQVARVYRAVDLFVSPSVGECPLTVLEAMASGLPVLLHEDPGHRALPVSDDGAWWADLRGDDLPQVLADRLGDDEELAERGLHARRAAEQAFSWEANLDRLGEVYGTVRPPRRRRTRVALVTPRFAPCVGGVESYTKRIADALRDSDDFEVVVITTAEGRRSTVDEVDGVTVHRLGTWATLSNSPVSPWWPVQLRRLMRRHRVDVIHAHAPVPGLADATLLAAGDVPVVVTYHAGSLVKGESSRIDALLRAYERWVLPRLFARAERVLAVSPAAARMAADQQVELVPPGVDVERFTCAPERPTLQVTYVGRIERTSAWKGLDVLLRGFAQVLAQCPEAQLHLVGSGDDVERLRKLAADLGIGHAVTWRGTLSGPDLVEAYHDASVVVLPSLTEAESFGMTLVEAMACGRAVVGSDIGGIGFVIRNGIDGLLVEAGDECGLAEALVSLLGDPDRRAAMGRAGREAATSRWSWSSTLSTTLRTLREATRATEGVQDAHITSRRS